MIVRWSTEMTEEEEQFGFEWVETQDPTDKSSYKPRKRKLVTKTLSENIMIFKGETHDKKAAYGFFRWERKFEGIEGWSTALIRPVIGFSVLKAFLEKFDPKSPKEPWEILGK
ncbi:hypothetical protein KAX06_03205 [candidate division WOR-3 bacterium]|nr:hypothetical protein [candidate division WOR-3 bacterium]